MLNGMLTECNRRFLFHCWGSWWMVVCIVTLALAPQSIGPILSGAGRLRQSRCRDGALVCLGASPRRNTKTHREWKTNLITTTAPPSAHLCSTGRRLHSAHRPHSFHRLHSALHRLYSVSHRLHSAPHRPFCSAQDAFALHSASVGFPHFAVRVLNASPETCFFRSPVCVKKGTILEIGFWSLTPLPPKIQS